MQFYFIKVFISPSHEMLGPLLQFMWLHDVAAARYCTYVLSVVTLY